MGGLCKSLLKEIFLDPMRLSINNWAIRMPITAERVSEVVHGKRGIVAGTALHLGKVFGMSAQMWLNMPTPASCPRLKLSQVQMSCLFAGICTAKLELEATA